MPLLLTRKAAYNTKVAVWKATENNKFFQDQLHLDSSEVHELGQMRAHRQREWLSSRYLLHWLSGDQNRRFISKTMTGKPYRVDCGRCISISHSRELVAVVISDTTVGIDIQKKEDKIVRIQHKFVSEEERSRLPEEKLKKYYHVFWGAKEAMYKAYGLKKLEFKEHMHVFPFVLGNEITEIKGKVEKGEILQYYDLEVEKVEDAFLVVCRLIQ